MSDQEAIPFTPYHPKFRQVQHDLSKLISLKEYAKLTHHSESTIRDRILRGSLVAYKLQSRWWLMPPD